MQTTSSFGPRQTSSTVGRSNPGTVSGNAPLQSPHHSAPGASRGDRLQHLLKVTKAHTKFHQMLAMQYAVEDYLLHARYSSGDTEVSGAPLQNPEPKGKNENQPLQVTHCHPHLFKKVRTAFGVDTDEYYRSLCCVHWRLLLSEGDHGMWFAGAKFIVKMIGPKKSKMLRQLTENYVSFVGSNPLTLLPRIYGHHEVTYGADRLCFVVINNVLSLDKAIASGFKLDGASKFEATGIPEACVKPSNGAPKPQLGPTRKKVFLEQVTRDLDFLKTHKLTNYALVGGVHHTQTQQTAGVWESEASQRTHGGSTADQNPLRPVFLFGIQNILDRQRPLAKLACGLAKSHPKKYAKRFYAATEMLVT